MATGTTNTSPHRGRIFSENRGPLRLEIWEPGNGSRYELALVELAHLSAKAEQQIGCQEDSLLVTWLNPPGHKGAKSALVHRDAHWTYLWERLGCSAADGEEIHKILVTLGELRAPLDDSRILRRRANPRQAGVILPELLRILGGLSLLAVGLAGYLVETYAITALCALALGALAWWSWPAAPQLPEVPALPPVEDDDPLLDFEDEPVVTLAPMPLVIVPPARTLRERRQLRALRALRHRPSLVQRGGASVDLLFGGALVVALLAGGLWIVAVLGGGR